MASPFKCIVGECSLANGGGHYRSQNERRGSPHWALEPDVQSFVYQQPVVHYSFEGQPRRYTGDTLVHFWSPRRPLVVEYKLASAIEKDPSLKPYHERIRGILKGRGLDFVVLTDLDIMTVSLKNKEFFLRFQADPESPFEGEVFRAVSAAGAIPLNDLLCKLRPTPDSQLQLVPVVWRLVAWRRLFVDFNVTPSRESLVSIKPLTPPFSMIAPRKFEFGGKNQAETDLEIAQFRKDRLLPYAHWRLRRPDAEKRCLSADINSLASELGCGADWIRVRVREMIDAGPENVDLQKFLKRAPDGGKGKSKLREELREPVAKAIDHAISRGAEPGSRAANRIVRRFLEQHGIPRARQPCAKALKRVSNAPHITIKFNQAVFGEHMTRVLGKSADSFAPNEVMFLDWSTFSSEDDDPTLTLRVYDRYRRFMGVANALFGVCGGTRGLWTLLPIVGAQNTYLTAWGIRRGLLSKQSLLEKYGLSGAWPFHGTPGRFVTDRGSEFIGEQIVRTLEEMGIPYRDLSPAEMPYMRAKSERFNRTAHLGMADFMHSEIGQKYFFPAPDVRGAMGILFEHLDRAFLEWAIVAYHPKGNKGLGGASPLERYSDMVHGHRGFPLSGPVIARPESATPMWNFLWEEKRIINHTGISIANRNYACDELTRFLQPGTRSSGRRQSVRFNPYALGRVLVRDPDTAEVLPVPYRHRNDILPLTAAQIEETKNPSIWEWNVAYRDLKRVGNPRPEPEQVFEVISKREALIKDPETVISATVTRRDVANFEMRQTFAQDGLAQLPNPTPHPPRPSAMLPTGRGGADEY
ncbi:MAG: hypothetical protein C0518_06820 [Opitutus sp.]|nr:hypothetical protein [Opitutus sp.]